MFRPLTSWRRKASSTAPPPSPPVTPPTRDQAKARLAYLVQETSTHEPRLTEVATPASPKPPPPPPLVATPAAAAPRSTALEPRLWWGPHVWREVEWRRMISVVVGLMCLQGLRTRVMVPVGLTGMDLLMLNNEQQLLLRCLGSLDTVSQHDVQTFVRWMRRRGHRSATLVTRGEFTPAARELAVQNRIHALDGHELLKLMARQSPSTQRNLLLTAYAGNSATPSCIHCGTKLSPAHREDTGRPFWRCEHTPSCQVQLPAGHTVGHPAMHTPSKREIRLKITVSSSSH